MNYKRLIPTLCVLTLVACTPAATTTDGDSSAGTATQTSSKPAMVASSKPAMVVSSTATAPAQTRVVDMTVSNWAFSPTTVTVKKGEKVQLRVTGGEGIHGFSIDSLGINVRVEGGTSVLVDVPTDTAGTFAGRCSVPCGPGHRDMKFTIIVE